MNGSAISCTNLPGNGVKPAVTGFTYVYPYSLTAVGQSQGAEATTLVDSGNLVFNATVAPAAGTVVSFASYGTFIDQYPPCSSPFIAGTLTGPFFTNGAWNFGTRTRWAHLTKLTSKRTPVGQTETSATWHGDGAHRRPPLRTRPTARRSRRHLRPNSTLARAALRFTETTTTRSRPFWMAKS